MAILIRPFPSSNHDGVDGVPMIRNLRLQHVEEEGFTNVRCTWVLGCPHEVTPRLDSTTASENDYSTVRVEAAYADAYRQFFPTQTVPEQVGTHCGAQFAMTKTRVRQRPLADYELYRRWLWDTKLDDSVSGRILEYTWHSKSDILLTRSMNSFLTYRAVIMGKPAVHCPDAGECFCQKYGLCNLKCQADHCEKRYKLPQVATIPDGWPKVGPGEHGFPENGWWE